ncbi:LacI family transcriptional regulator [Agromyces intestinalis]|uniref:LacI family transcriptional regulator n=1 Tax=Agromyces intestinalis TaxID=2592652 RepID=A0A5C1YLT1_9MICO|nr:LacI family transcriptional regulator [Agromyces intestinalis]
MGLVLARSAEILGDEPYFHEFVAGAERVLRPLGRSILLHVLPTRREELDCYRRWARDGHVEAVVLVDLSPADRRVSLVRELGLPAVAIGDAASGGGLDTVWTQDDLAMRSAVEYLAGLDHTRLAHVSGPALFSHTLIRTEAFDDAVAELGLTGRRIASDYSERSGYQATLDLLVGDAPPTAIVFDNDLMALGGLSAARDLDLEVPRDLSLLAWDDSALCQLSEPPLSAMSHDVQQIGELAARAVLAMLAGDEPELLRAEPAVVVPRGTTAVPGRVDGTADAPADAAG